MPSDLSYPAAEARGLRPASPLLGRIHAALRPIGYPVMRIFVGLAFIPHGYQKLSLVLAGHSAGFAHFFAAHGFVPGHFWLARSRRGSEEKMRYGMNCLVAASFALALLIGAGSAGAATILHLSSSATVKVMPDQLDATLAAEAGADTPVQAQAAVNAMVSRALAQAGAVSAVTASTGSYTVWHVGDPHPGWRAQQTIRLTATDGPALLALVGTLQADGLAVSSLAWSLKEQTDEAAHDKAEAMALIGLKAKAERAAKLLGLHFAGFRTVWLVPPEGPPPRPMALMAARAMPEPSAVSGEASVTATVTAEAKLDQQ